MTDPFDHVVGVVPVAVNTFPVVLIAPISSKSSPATKVSILYVDPMSNDVPTGRISLGRSPTSFALVPETVALSMNSSVSEIHSVSLLVLEPISSDSVYTPVPSVTSILNPSGVVCVAP